MALGRSSKTPRVRCRPEQIAKRLRRDHPNEPQWWVSHESIYQAIYVQAKGELRKELAACLKSGRARRRPWGRHGHNPNATARRIARMVNISERPAEVEPAPSPGTGRGTSSPERTTSRSWPPSWSARRGRAC